MNPTLRQGLSLVTRACTRLGLGRGGLSPVRAKSRRALVPQVGGLEDRVLQYFAVKATAVPNTLWPPSGHYVPVVISGTALEFSIVKNKQVFGTIPGPKKANFKIVDEYRQDEPSGPLTLVDQGKGKYTFQATVYLQARRAKEFIAGRRYYVTIAANDSDGWGSREIPVQVPKSLQDRGPGPIKTVQVAPRKTTHRKAGATTNTSGISLPFL